MLITLVSLALYFHAISFATAQVYPHYNVLAHKILTERNNVIENNTEWWQTASFYQIYPRSFKDSNGDGVGDINGITDNLHYLKEIGITATWLSPIFTSPMADFGYDIANFTEIDKIFGTMLDFERLLMKAKTLDIGIILDFVPNHTSDECEWFKKSAAGDPEFKDFYVWHPGKIINGTRAPPTNWLSVFRGSGWTWHEGRGEYYFHQFLKKQPDLNYRNPKVRETMQNILIYWLQKGVVGFRIDAVPHLFEIADNNGYLPDEPRNYWNNDPDDYGYLQHIYTIDQPETFDLIYEWRHVLDEFTKKSGDNKQRIMLAESSSPIETEMKYYGNGTVDGAQIPFNFLLLYRLNNDSNANDYTDAVYTWLNFMPANRTANWVIGNHDQNRVGSRLGTDRIDMMNMLLLTLPGCSITYQGEEIGMTDVWISWNDTVDPSACNSNPDIYERFSRDPERTPFQWSAEKNAGFSVADKTWLPVADNYKTVNVEIERNNSVSHLSVYKQLQKLRQEPTMRLGSVEVKPVNTNVFAVKRTLDEETTYITLMNIFDNRETFDLHNTFLNLTDELEYVVITSKSIAHVGDRVKINAMHLEPKEAVVFRMAKTPSAGLQIVLYTIFAFCSILTACMLLSCCLQTMHRNAYSTI